MSDHVLMIFFKQVEENMQGLLSILSLLRNYFNKFNITGARMLDWIFHRTLKLFTNLILARKR